MGNKFNKVSLKEKKTIDIARHEILMSFHNDSGAMKFHRWWHKEGSKLFQKWLDEKS